jgi:hypothetical protein
MPKSKQGIKQVSTKHETLSIAVAEYITSS